MMKKQNNKGFIALIAIVLLTSGTLAFSLVTVGTAASYADSIMRRELRTYAGLSVRGCIESLVLMAERDYFLAGSVSFREFGCTAYVENNFSGKVTISATSSISGVIASVMIEMIQ